MKRNENVASRFELERRKKAAEQTVTRSIAPILNGTRQGTSIATTPLELLRNNSAALTKESELLEAKHREILGTNGVIETLASIERELENYYE